MEAPNESKQELAWPMNSSYSRMPIFMRFLNPGVMFTFFLLHIDIREYTPNRRPHAQSITGRSPVCRDGKFRCTCSARTKILPVCNNTKWRRSQRVLRCFSAPDSFRMRFVLRLWLIQSRFAASAVPNKRVIGIMFSIARATLRPD